MYSTQPNSEQVTSAIAALSGPDRELASRAYKLMQTIDGSNPALLPLLVQGLNPLANGDLNVSCALAISRYGDKAQSHMDAIAKLLIPECEFESSAANAVIYAVSRIHCSRSVEVFRELLKSEDPFILYSVIDNFKTLGGLAKGLIPALRELEKKDENLGIQIRIELQEYYRENSGMDLDEQLEGRSEFTAVHLHGGSSDYSPEAHQIREIDMSRQGLLHDERLDFRLNGGAGMCRLRIGKDDQERVAVLFSYDAKSSGISIQNAIEYLASTVHHLFPDLPENVSWYEHWCPSSGIVNKIELKLVAFEFNHDTASFYNPRWLRVDAPQRVAGRFGFDLSEFSGEL